MIGQLGVAVAIVMAVLYLLTVLAIFRDLLLRCRRGIWAALLRTFMLLAGSTLATGLSLAPFFVMHGHYSNADRGLIIVICLLNGLVLISIMHWLLTDRNRQG